MISSSIQSATSQTSGQLVREAALRRAALLEAKAKAAQESASEARKEATLADNKADNLESRASDSRKSSDQAKRMSSATEGYDKTYSTISRQVDTLADAEVDPIYSQTDYTALSADSVELGTSIYTAVSTNSSSSVGNLVDALA